MEREYLLDKGVGEGNGGRYHQAQQVGTGGKYLGVPEACFGMISLMEAGKEPTEGSFYIY